jgi:hypothetical protein
MMAELASVLQHKLTLHGGQASSLLESFAWSGACRQHTCAVDVPRAEDSSHDDGGSDDASDSSSTPRSSDSEGSGSDADDDDAASSACDETRAADTSSPSDLLGAQLQGLHCTAPKQLPAQGGQAVPTQAGQHGSSAGGRTAAAATMAQGGACPAPTRIQLAPSSFSLSATQRRQLRQQLADALEAERDAAVQSALQDRDPLLAAM